MHVEMSLLETMSNEITDLCAARILPSPISKLVSGPVLLRLQPVRRCAVGVQGVLVVAMFREPYSTTLVKVAIKPKIRRLVRITL